MKGGAPGWPGSHRADLLGVSALNGTFDRQTPAILLASEPWFLLGGEAYGSIVLKHRRSAPATCGPTGGSRR